MANVFIINGHNPPTPGDLNSTLAERAEVLMTSGGHRVQSTRVVDEWDNDTEIAKLQWADLTILQFPVHWMNLPWRFKQYMDDVWSAGMDGRLADGDGRTRSDQNKPYGSGGTLNSRYLLSVTFNAPQNAFDDPGQWLFEGRSVDDMLAPVHLTCRFMALHPLETFAMFDVVKNPDIDNDLLRFDRHVTDAIRQVADQGQ